MVNWSQADCAIQLSVLLGKKVLNMYSRLSQKDGLDCGCFQATLSLRYNYTEQEYRRRF